MITINPTENQNTQANNFMNAYREGGFGKNVLGVSDDEYYHYIYIGKLCEVVFCDYLIDLGIQINNNEMLVPHEAEHRHGADFILTNSYQEVDIKAANKPFHVRLLVREDQFLAHIHDVYIGAKWISDKEIQFHGYVSGEDLKDIIPKDFGYGLCRHLYLNQLLSIEQFIERASQGQPV